VADFDMCAILCAYSFSRIVNLVMSWTSNCVGLILLYSFTYCSTWMCNLISQPKGLTEGGEEMFRHKSNEVKGEWSFMISTLHVTLSE
jgi:hypothetical protein